jgi:hypothetical protein
MDEAQKKPEANQAGSEALPQEMVVDEAVDTTFQDETAFRREDFSGVEDRDTGRARILDDVGEHTANDPIITGGDIDANLEQAEVSGEEAVGGTSPTPDQNNVDELAASVGTEVFDQEDRYATDELDQRDSRRWELDPKSSEDYRERRE